MAYHNRSTKVQKPQEPTGVYNLNSLCVFYLYILAPTTKHVQVTSSDWPGYITASCQLLVPPSGSLFQHTP